MTEPLSTAQLCSARCVPCEGGVPKLTAAEALEQLAAVPEWQIEQGPDRITRSWKVRNFSAGMQFLNRVAELAEEEGHHPDVHIEGYRNLSISVWTHAIGGLSLNDFILAARIDQLPIDLQSAPKQAQ